MGNKKAYQLHGSAIFDRYLARKSTQPKEDQYGEAGALISEIKTVDADKAYFALYDRIRNHSRVHMIWSRFSRIAAILIIPLLIFTVWKQVDEEKPDVPVEISYQEISNPSGIRSSVVLPDGTKVWLNAESRIRYSIPFINKTREVELVGEAFLNVAKNPDSPFEVRVNQFTVRALGTQFNVKAFPGDGQVEVVLKEGSIQLDNNTESAQERIHLKPNELWVYDKISRSAVLKKVDADEHIAWHRNRLVLNKTTMAELAVQLERWYGVQVEIKDQGLYKYRFTTVFDNEPLHRVIELLEMSSPIRINYIPGEYNTGTGDVEKSIIQISAKQ
ncbi:MAG: FecR domain-containing protein [Prolixibacteraceae bacterium]